MECCGQVALADARLAVEAVQRCFRSDADQVAIAFFVFGQHEQVVVVVALRGGAMVLVLAHVELAAEDGLDALLLGGVEEVDGAVDVAVVGHGHGFLAEFGDAVDEFLDVAGAVEQGVFGVQMEVGEFGHRYFDSSFEFTTPKNGGRGATGAYEEKASETAGAGGSGGLRLLVPAAALAVEIRRKTADLQGFPGLFSPGLVHFFGRCLL